MSMKKVKGKKPRGAAMVEFAIGASLFFFVIFAGLELLMYGYVLTTVQAAAVEAVHVAALGGTDTDILNMLQKRGGRYATNYDICTVANPTTCNGTAWRLANEPIFLRIRPNFPLTIFGRNTQTEIIAIGTNGPI